MRYASDGDPKFQTEKLLNNGLNYKDNFDGRWLEVTLGQDDTEVRHGLGHVPSFFHYLPLDEPALVAGVRVKEWTKDILFCRSSVPNVRVRLFVM